MFPSGDGKTWEPYKTRQVKKQPAPSNGADVEMGGTEEAPKKEDEDEAEYEEDMESDEGAVYPLTGGFIQRSINSTILMNNSRGSYYEHAGLPSIAQPRTQYSQSHTSHTYTTDSTTGVDSSRS
jgi:hypothetical protein